MSIHVCKCTHNGNEEYHLRYPGMPESAAQALADKINSGLLQPPAPQDDVLNEWQPIQTAPVCKTVIISGGGMTPTTGYRLGASWRVVDYPNQYVHPTLWMPLPAINEPKKG